MNRSRDETALGTARARFVDGLGRKAAELRSSVTALGTDPGAERPREELRRRLHALYASAQVFRMDPMAEQLREALDRLDAARDHARPLGQDDLEVLSELALELPALGKDLPPGTPSTSPGNLPGPSLRGPATGSSRPARPRKSTLSGIIAQRRKRISLRPAAAPPPTEPAVDPDEAETVVGLETDELSFAGLVDPQEVPTAPGTVPGSYSASFSGRASPSDRIGSRPLDTILSVLVLEGPETADYIRSSLGEDGYEVAVAGDAEEALRLSRTGAPDVVVAARRLVGDSPDDFTARLRDDPLTDCVPIVLLLEQGTANDLVAVFENGIDATLRKPLDAEELGRTIRRVTATLPGSSRSLDSFGELTADELADRLAREFRRGLADSASSGRDVKVPIGEGSEILAAAWSTIARVRAQVTAKSGGRVRFRDRPGRFGPSLVAMSEELPERDATDIDLTGRRIVVADDDPAVAWFFSGLLREAGAQVVEAADGQEALEEARRNHPDVVLSDILMPRMDGFRLCRCLAGEPVLADVPIVLLSWKEDFLQRMRDLEAGASGYLRKEAPAAQILSKVAEVLSPRERLESQLDAGGAAQGRLEGMGIGGLLRSVGVKRPNARVTVRDAWSLFEVDLRHGKLSEVTQTAADGSFVRGEAALPQLLGMTSGRFTVETADAEQRGRFRETLSQTIQQGAAELGAAFDAVRGAMLPLVAELRLRPEVLQGLRSVFPEALLVVVDRLRDGESPASLSRDPGVDPRALEEVLIDLVRRGAVDGIYGADGRDRVSECLKRRSESTVRLPMSMPSDPETVPASVGDESDESGEANTGDVEFTHQDRDEPATTVPGMEIDPVAEAAFAPSSPRPGASQPPNPTGSLPGGAPSEPTLGSRRQDGVGAVTFALVLTVSLVLGFVGFRWVHSMGVVDKPALASSTRVGAPAGPRVHPVDPVDVTDPEAEPDLSFARVLPRVDDAEIEVPEGHGVVRIDTTSDPEGLRVVLNGEPVEGWPIERALPSGRHDLELQRGDETIFRYVTVRPGHTHVIPTP